MALLVYIYCIFAAVVTKWYVIKLIFAAFGEFFQGTTV